MSYRWHSAWDSHPGNVRSLNEDAVYANPELGLWAVADGMGGHDAGEVASNSITRALMGVELTDSLTDRVDTVEDTLLYVNDELRSYGRTHCAGNTVGSTVVALVVKDCVGVVLWAGDSRLYRVRDRSIAQITRDHNPVVDLLDSGGVSEREALSADTNVITRAVGGQLDLHLDVAVFDIQPLDTLILCSDGLYREVEESSLVSAFATKGLQADVEGAVQDVMAQCLRGAARDNVSLAVAQAVEL